MALFDEARSVDPLGLDSFFYQTAAVVEQPADVMLRRLEAIVRDADESALDNTCAALAALRDLDFLLCAVHLADPFAYKAVSGLESLLVRLGQRTGQIPRGSNSTYGPCNPPDDRMRLFTGLPEERMFVRAIADGLRGLDGVLSGLATMAHHPVDSPTVVTAAGDLVPAWEPMIEASVKMLRGMPPEVFSGRIVPCFVPLDIAGATYQGITGAQSPNVGIDYLLWGVESAVEEYRSYARTNLAEQLPAHRQLVAEVLERTGEASLLTHIERQLCTAHRPDLSAAAAVLTHLESLLRRIGTFRAAHRRLAELNMQRRTTQIGSGGHTLHLLDELMASTRQARNRVRALRDDALRAAADCPVPGARRTSASIRAATHHRGTAQRVRCGRR
jgi:hypothetical protein